MSTRVVTRVTIHAAKTHLSRLIARVEAGEEVHIVRGKGEQPVARLLPPKPKKRKVPQFGWLKGQMQLPDDSAFAPMTAEEAEAEGWM